MIRWEGGTELIPRTIHSDNPGLVCKCYSTTCSDQAIVKSFVSGKDRGEGGEELSYPGTSLIFNSRTST